MQIINVSLINYNEPNLHYEPKSFQGHNMPLFVFLNYKHVCLDEVIQVYGAPGYAHIY